MVAGIEANIDEIRADHATAPGQFGGHVEQFIPWRWE